MSLRQQLAILFYFCIQRNAEYITTANMRFCCSLPLPECLRHFANT